MKERPPPKTRAPEQALKATVAFIMIIVAVVVAVWILFYVDVPCQSQFVGVPIPGKTTVWEYIFGGTCRPRF